MICKHFQEPFYLKKKKETRKIARCINPVNPLIINTL